MFKHGNELRRNYDGNTASDPVVDFHQMPDDFFSSPFYTEALSQAANDFQRLRFFTAFIQERKQSTPKLWREIMTAGHYKNLNASFWTWHNLERERKLPLGLLEALDIDLTTLQRVVELDRVEFEKETQREIVVDTFIMRATAAIYVRKHLKQIAPLREAWDIVQKFAVAKRMICWIDTSVAFYTFRPDGSVVQMIYEPRIEVVGDKVIIYG